MSVNIKFALALVLCLLAIIAGGYFAGWLALRLLGLGDQVSLDGSTYWQYWRVIELPDFAPYATQIKIAGGVGFGLPLLIWLGLVWLLHRYLPARAGNAGHTFPDARTAEPLAPNEQHEQRMLRKIQQANEETEHEQGHLPPSGPPAPPKRKPNLPKQCMADATPPAPEIANPTEQEQEMNLKQATAATLVASAVLVGCTPSQDKIHYQVKDNPDPRQRYELTLTLHNSPGPFRSVDARAHYSAPTCIHTESISGAQSWPEATKNIEMIQVSETMWKGIFYADALLNENYYNKGVCRWQFDFANIYFSATDAPADTLFNAASSGKNPLSDDPTVTYFARKGYPHPPATSNEVDSKHTMNNGLGDRSLFGPNISDSDLFTATLNIRETP